MKNNIIKNIKNQHMKVEFLKRSLRTITTNLTGERVNSSASELYDSTVNDLLLIENKLHYIAGRLSLLPDRLEYINRKEQELEDE